MHYLLEQQNIEQFQALIQDFCRRRDNWFDRADRMLNPASEYLSEQALQMMGKADAYANLITFALDRFSEDDTIADILTKMDEFLKTEEATPATTSCRQAMNNTYLAIRTMISQKTWNTDQTTYAESF